MSDAAAMRSSDVGISVDKAVDVAKERLANSVKSKFDKAKEALFYPEGADEAEKGVREGDVPAAPTEAKVDPALYDLYAGEYELAPGFILTVRREGSRLLTRATGQEEFEVFPASETEFFPKVVDARITFVKGSDGKVTGLVLRQGGREMPAKRLR